MTLNTYFKQFQGQTNEQALMQSLATESIQIAGIQTFYMPRSMQTVDTILNEDPYASFSDYYDIEMYLQTYEGFQGIEADELAKEGLVLNDQLRLIVSKERFCEETDTDKPLSGDLIYLPLTDTLFQIEYVDDELDFYQLGDVYTWTITATIFDYSSEDFDTGLEAIDDIDDPLAEQELMDKELESNDAFEVEDDDIIDFSDENVIGTFAIDD